MKYSYTAALLTVLSTAHAATDPGVAVIEGQCLTICQTAEDQCRTMPGANISTCVSEFERCKAGCQSTGTKVSSSTAAPVTTTATSSHAGSSSSSASQTAQTTTTAATTTSGGNQCLATCQTAEDQCRGRPGANISTCVSEFEKCKAACSTSQSSTSAPVTMSTVTGTPTKTVAPTTTAAATTGSATTPAVTAGSGKLYPALGLLSLLGVAALL
ncbi:alpha beta hydrolase fold family [Purpureocillium lavendulum]|uniref:Alpha beta hydrolase fold family n=1 Tax=Purpureocillium lavendulum TaxID=1247861 RepID=A0AB34FDX8_9HYPO|nr:alpha beta hydrolase fold family [Purpureocillium lavendulum]